MNIKLFSKIVLSGYLFFLLWLVLFKFSYDIPGVLLNYNTRSLNLVPFVDSIRDMVNNIVYFIPLGLLLGINFKQVTIWRKLAFVFALSLGVEILQFIFAIGRTDINDVIANTLGGLIGLGLYEVIKKYIRNEKLDQLIIIILAVLLMIFFYLRIFVFRVQY